MSRPSSMTSLVGSNVVMRWEKYGWQLGRINGIITNATPRKKLTTTALFGPTAATKGPTKLRVENYGHGPDARYNPWGNFI